jgi:FkbM family methyltransferase
MPKLKILWSSVTPTIESGYGRVSREVVTRLVDRGYDVMYHGYQTMGKLHTIDGKIKMLDCGGPEYGMNVLGRYFEQYKRDILITLYDLWAFFGKIEKVNAAWIPYFPIDAEPVSIPQSDPLRYAYKRICFSKFALRELKKVNLGAEIIYHGVDTKIYTPYSEERKKAIRKKTGIPENAFMVGSNGANTWDRKDFPRVIRIFSEFVKKNNAKDALLYLHANPDGLEGKAYSLMELAKLYDITDQVRYAHQKNQLWDSGLAKMYNTLDVYLTASRAEGCGLPILEAQACGVPAIVPNNSAQPEWVEGHGWVVPCSDHIVTLTTPLHNKWYLMDVEKAVEALTEAYQNKELRLKYGKEAREAMLQYDWDKIVDEQWLPFLQKVEEEITTGIVKQEAGGKIYNMRINKIDRPVVYMVVIFKEYSKYLDLTKDDIWLDIGGHIGTFSIDVSDKVKQIYAFEPEPGNYELLEKNIAENKIENILIFNAAVVGNYDLEREFHLDEKDNTGGHSLIAADGKAKITVKCRNINDILKTYNINKVKMDCEGAEYEIIKSMDLTNIKELIMEFHFNLLGLTKFEELVALLRKKFEVVQTDKVINPYGQGKIYCGSSKNKIKGREEH